MKSFALISAPFDTKIYPISFKSSQTTRWSGVYFLKLNCFYLFKSKLVKINTFIFLSIKALKLRYAPFDIKSSNISFEFFSAAKWSGVLFFWFNFLYLF